MVAKMEISSFSAVATHEVKREAAVMAFSIRQFYDCPIYFCCDSATRAFLSDLPLTNLEYILGAEENVLPVICREYMNVAIKNDFHRVDCIALKMGCLSQAVRETGNTMFLDTDIILVDSIHEDINRDLMLSPHYNYKDRVRNYREYGVFNAGYLWTNREEVGEVWKDIYLDRSSFFEQQGMIWFLEYFNVGCFDESHNVGFWRMPLESTQVRRTPCLQPNVVDWDNTKSLHAHVFKECYHRADSGLMRVYDQNREIALAHCGLEVQDFIGTL